MSSHVRARILIVEDYAPLGDNLAEILALCGYVPLTVASAEAALEELARTPVDAILTDYCLPGMDGAALISRLRALRVATPTLLMNDRANAQGDGLSTLDCECVPKPFDIPRLLSTLGRVLDQGVAAT